MAMKNGLHQLSAEIQQVFQSAMNPSNMGPMKAYMKNLFNFLGIKSPERAELLRPLLTRDKLPPSDEIWPVIHDLWNLPEREFQYAGMEVFSRYNRKVRESWIEYYTYMITNKSWWDTVDFIAATLAGNYFRYFPGKIPEVTGQWMQSGNIWLQRSCLLFQLKYKQSTDNGLLSSFIVPLSGSREFFIAKAIGWALREYSKTDPAWVLSFVESHQLQPLSHKEALKRMPS
jgi:3-methyladenine DNA glycosylase AlkD